MHVGAGPGADVRSVFSQRRWIASQPRSFQTAHAFPEQSTKVRHQRCPKGLQQIKSGEWKRAEMLRVIRGVAALLVWIVAGEMREQEGTQQIKFKAAEMRVHVM